VGTGKGLHAVAAAVSALVALGLTAGAFAAKPHVTYTRRAPILRTTRIWMLPGGFLK
jgi:hypothetical protein